MSDGVSPARLATAAGKASHWTQERDRLIVEAVKSGKSLREVAEYVGMSHMGVARIVKRESNA